MAREAPSLCPRQRAASGLLLVRLVSGAPSRASGYDVGRFRSEVEGRRVVRAGKTTVNVVPAPRAFHLDGARRSALGVADCDPEAVPWFWWCRKARTGSSHFLREPGRVATQRTTHRLAPRGPAIAFPTTTLPRRHGMAVVKQEIMSTWRQLSHRRGCGQISVRSARSRPVVEPEERTAPSTTTP